MIDLPVPFGFLGISGGFRQLNPFGKFKEIGQNKPGNIGDFLRFFLPDRLDRVHVFIRDAANAVRPVFKVGRKQSRFRQHVYAAAEVLGDLLSQTPRVLTQHLVCRDVQRRSESTTCDAWSHIGNQRLFRIQHALTDVRRKQFRRLRFFTCWCGLPDMPRAPTEMKWAGFMRLSTLENIEHYHFQTIRVLAGCDSLTFSRYITDSFAFHLLYVFLVQYFTYHDISECDVFGVTAGTIVLKILRLVQCHA